MSFSVELPPTFVAQWGFTIRLIDDICEWLLENIGNGDVRFWSRTEDLEHHIQNCRDGNTCLSSNIKCDGNEVWGWTIEFYGSHPRVRFIFREADHAMLFKLTWGGM